MEAVLVAAVSVLGTVAGAVLTAVAAARSERRRDAADQREREAQDEAIQHTQAYERALEHQRWRRERRQAAYLAFLSALGTADRVNQEHFHTLQQTPQGAAVNEERLRRIRHHFKEAESASHTVMLEGPETIAEAAHTLVIRFSGLVQDVREYAQVRAAANGDLGERTASVHAAGMAFIAAHKDFLAAARTALDEPA
ncbi:hypothetical protein IPZ58_27635 [Streptomyces roseoverticillatus]|uniref:hypothetical protein n=1 Tax=Streptomyces roseoverticillatus TaxID=66429 RepID=UPI001F24BEEF|nr:hypothetical protein [Streptomyces roseoverticillatus]MCF3105337.1 hypothetical protein [Streptomyces roseoverticillatus]